MHKNLHPAFVLFKFTDTDGSFGLLSEKQLKYSEEEWRNTLFRPELSNILDVSDCMWRSDEADRLSGDNFRVKASLNLKGPSIRDIP